MFRTFLCSSALLVALGLLERTFFSAVSGGSWPMDLIMIAAAIRMTAFRTKGVIVWVAVAAIVSEMFAQGPFGAAAVGMMLGLIGARLLLFYLFSHRSTVSRVICASTGVALGATSTAAVRITLSVMDGSAGGPMVTEMASGSASVAFASALVAGVMTAALAAVEVRVRWLIGKGKPTIYAVS